MAHFGVTSAQIVLALVSLCGIPQAMFCTVISAALHAHKVQLQRDASLAAIYAVWIAEDILRAQETQTGGARAGPSRGDGRARSARRGPHASRWRFGARQRHQRSGGHGNETEICSAQASCSMLMLCFESWGDAQNDHCERRGDTGMAQTPAGQASGGIALQRGNEHSTDAGMAQTVGVQASETEHLSTQAESAMHIFSCVLHAEKQCDHHQCQEDTGVAQTPELRGQDRIAFKRSLEKPTCLSMAHTVGVPCAFSAAARETNCNSSRTQKSIRCSSVSDTLHAEEIRATSSAQPKHADMSHTFGSRLRETKRRTAQANYAMRLLSCASRADGHSYCRERQGDTGVAKTSAVRGRDGVPLTRSSDKPDDADMVQTFDTQCALVASVRETSSRAPRMRTAA